MSAAQRSIGQRLGKARSIEAKRATVHGWADDWRAEQAAQIEAVRGSIRAADGVRALQVLAEMQEMHGKRFAALPGVLDALLAYEADPK